MTNRHWGDLMVAGQAGNGGAYRRLLEETREWLQRYYARRLPSSMVDDATQEALIAVHDKRHTYDPSLPFGPWLAAIARYKWIDRLRALKSRPTEALSDDFPSRDHAEAVTSAAVLDQLLGTLKPAQSEVIRLVKIYGLSIEEASVRTGQSASLVKVNIHRGLSLLAKMAGQESYAEG
jgi:RNA polymerase sigma factor (sigma-70 family)